MDNNAGLVIFGDADPRAVEQLTNCLSIEEGALGVLCADSHVGYSQPIGGVVAYRDHISPSGVGYDIGCGNKAVRTDIRLEDVDVRSIMDEITRRISFGVGRPNSAPVEHPVIDAIAEADFEPQRALRDLAAAQLGTVGAGNHYVDLFADEDGFLWVGVHFGSRGFGHKTASGFLSLAEGGGFHDKAPDGEMFAPPVAFKADSALGESYIAAMNLAGAYAYAGRDVVVNTVLDILGARSVFEVHNHHNFAWRETHSGEDFWVIRKGATPAFPGQQGFVGSSMGAESVILSGTVHNHAGLFSTVHGAGRVMSRTKAAGKVRRRWTCIDCEWVQPPFTHKPADGLCPKCQGEILRKTTRTVRGEVDWPAVQLDIYRRGIVLKGAAADEAPQVYKNLDDVLDAHYGTIEIERYLTPVGVAMAGPGVNDPYKD